MASFHPDNWSQACAHWIHEIQVVFDPPVPSEPGNGGFLRLTRLGASQWAALVALAFTLHCTRPPSTFTRPLPPPGRMPVSAPPAPFVEEGTASWYGGDGDGFAGQPTASGEPYDPDAYTCAHRTLPLGTLVEVTNLRNGEHALFRVNDRGPFARGRILDLSRKGAKVLGFLDQGVARVRIETVNPEGVPVPLDPALDQQDPYVVQVAALSDPANIAALEETLGDAFGPVSLQDAVTQRGVLVKRVRVGSYTQRGDAEKAAQQIAKLLKDRGIEPFITRRR